MNFTNGPFLFSCVEDAEKFACKSDAIRSDIRYLFMFLGFHVTMFTEIAAFSLESLVLRLIAVSLSGCGCPSFIVVYYTRKRRLSETDRNL